jgi:ATP-dependent DNA helicase PIF1
MAINKSQGQTFDKICLYLPRHAFRRGKLYVTLSRVRSLDSLSVVSENNPEIENYVFREIFD